MHTSTVTEKGQIVIPASLRRKLGFKKGIKVAISESDGGIRVEPIDEMYFNRYVGLLEGGAEDVIEALLSERHEDRAREDVRP